MKYLITLMLLMPTVSFASSHFQTGSAVPTDALIQELRQVYFEKIKDKDVTDIVVEGHTDSRGGDAYNMKLSAARAKSAAEELVKLGADKSKIKTVGKGETELLALGSTALDHAKNRRVVIIVGDSAGAKTVTVISEAKECKPVVITKVVERRVVVEKIKKDKNILSLTVTRAVSDYDIQQNGNSVHIENRYKPVLGLMYQRNVVDSLYLGVAADLNKGLGASVGIGF